MSSQPYEFRKLTNNSDNTYAHKNLDLLKDISVPYNVTIGKKTMKIKDVQELNINDTIPLGYRVGDLFPLYMGDGEQKVIAWGIIEEHDGDLFFRIKKIK